MFEWGAFLINVSLSTGGPLLVLRRFIWALLHLFLSSICMEGGVERGRGR